MSQAQYIILGLTPSATKSEILSAYRKLSLKYHPDKGGDAAEFVKLADAKDKCLAAIEQPVPRAAPRQPRAPAPPVSPQEHMAQRTAGQQHSDLSAADIKPFTYHRTKLSDWAHKLARIHKVRSEKRERREEELREQQARQQSCAFEADVLAQAMRYTKMQEEARARGIRC